MTKTQLHASSAGFGVPNVESLVALPHSVFNGWVNGLPSVTYAKVCLAGPFAVMQRTLLHSSHLKHSLGSAACLQHGQSLLKFPLYAHRLTRRKLHFASTLQSRKGLSELLSLQETP